MHCFDIYSILSLSLLTANIPCCERPSTWIYRIMWKANLKANIRAHWHGWRIPSKKSISMWWSKIVIANEAIVSIEIGLVSGCVTSLNSYKYGIYHCRRDHDGACQKFRQRKSTGTGESNESHIMRESCTHWPNQINAVLSRVNDSAPLSQDTNRVVILWI